MGRSVGVDIGSRAIKVVLLEDGRIADTRQTDTGFDPLANARGLLEGLTYDRMLATGYGRHLFELEFDVPTVTEIKAHAAGMHARFPQARVMLDIGGQDSKVIALDGSGRVARFEMNDRCAAGTGKFLEIMARTLGFDLGEFGAAALEGAGTVQINSMCTVFAESEVTSMLAKGKDRREIALGIHRSVFQRALGMLKRVGITGPVAFSGGGARNPCLCRLLQQQVPEVLIPDSPHLTGALGAALLADTAPPGP